MQLLHMLSYLSWKLKCGTLKSDFSVNVTAKCDMYLPFLLDCK